jgi:beta-lactamase class A
MAELEGASRKKTQSGFGLFKSSTSSRRGRRRSTATPTSLPASTQLPGASSSSTLDLPSFQEPRPRISASTNVSAARKKPSNPLAWLLGQRSERRKPRGQSGLRANSHTGQRSARESGDRRSGRSSRFTAAPGGNDIRGTALPALPHLADSAQDTGNTLVPFPPPSPRSEPPSRRRRRSPRTQLQVANPTLMQQPTALQQATDMQSVDLEAGSRLSNQSRRSERSMLTPRSRSTAIALYVARMLILSIGVGVLAGTVLSAWNPGNTLFLADVSRQPVKQVESPAPANAPHSAAAHLALTSEITPLKTKLQALTQQAPGFTPGLFLIDLDNYNYVDLTGATPFPAASMIKLPILIAFFQDVDAGKIRLDDKLAMSKDMIAQGSGDMQSMPPGTQFTALETATQMIIASDNTATNMLIARLGGIAALNERFKSWGLTNTALKNVLPDLEGTNLTSPKELANLMVRVSQGELVSMRSRDRMLSIMQRTLNNSQLPQGLGEGATIAHKTGDIGTLIGDVGLVDMPNGKRYAVAVMVKRSFNDDRAYDLVQKMSSAVYQHLNGMAQAGRPVNPSLSPSPSVSPDAEAQNLSPDAQHNLDDSQHGPNDTQPIPDSELNPTDSTHQESNPDQASHQ